MMLTSIASWSFSISSPLVGSWKKLRTLNALFNSRNYPYSCNTKGFKFPGVGGPLRPERHRESKVFCPRTQHNVPGQGLNPSKYMVETTVGALPSFWFWWQHDVSLWPSQLYQLFSFDPEHWLSSPVEWY